MAPGRPRDPSVDQDDKYERFIADLTSYHQQRGTNFEPQPKVGTRHVNLLKLYDLVTGKGGYDAVSGEKLLWRKLCQEFNFGNTNVAAQAFALKTAYYKNLAAYEISTFHHKEPPPKEILEDLSARGGDLLSRTLDNYRPHGGRDSMLFTNGDASDGSGDERSGTPKGEKGDGDELGGSGRATRSLRHAPPQRVLFQPDIASARQTRHPSAHTSSPQPSYQPAVATYLSQYSNSPFKPSFLEPRNHVPLTLRPVVTPGNNFGLFRDKQRALQEAKDAQDGRSKTSVKGIMLPGTGFEGPNIYVRTLLSLRSGIPQEQDYALHHLVKISHERGDKYKFDAFPGLAEGLVEKVLEISSLFYDVHWRLSHTGEEATGDPSYLNTLSGTPHILARIHELDQIRSRDDMSTQEFTHRMVQVNEASLVLRNMAMLDDNAARLARMPQVKDWIIIALNLPSDPEIIELRHNALEIAEQLTKFYSLDSDDALYQSLLRQLQSLDRGAILTALRAISRISMNLEENNRLKDVPISTIQQLYQWTLVDDEELVYACLDFFYQFTAMAENVEIMLQGIGVDGLVNQLVRLLLYGARETESRKMIKAPVKDTSATHLPELPAALLKGLLSLEEPERSSQWLRCCFEENNDSDITQIALWQAYQTRFAEHNTGHRPMLPAAEFIKNVSSTFTNATAQVIQGPNPKFIIKGIRPRHVPADLHGRKFMRCLWRTGPSSECGAFLLNSKEMWEHLVSQHLGLKRLEDGSWDLRDDPKQDYYCWWSGCRKFAEGSSTAYAVGMHVKTHLPDASEKANLKAKGNVTRETLASQSGEYQTQTSLNTTVDERGDAAGLPLTAVLVLRNLARNLPKGDSDVPLVQKLFSPVESRLWYVMAHNKSLAGYMADLMGTISASARRR